MSTACHYLSHADDAVADADLLPNSRMSVRAAPGVVHGRICRIVSPVPSLLELEEWFGERWEPSSVPITAASVAAPALESELVAQGVPSDDWGLTDPPAQREALEAPLPNAWPEPGNRRALH